MFRKLQRVDYIADPDKPFSTPTLRRDLIKGRITQMVRTAKESPFAQWASPVLLTIILGYVVYNGQTTNSDIKDLNRAIAVLQTQKAEQEKELDRERQEKFQFARESEVWREKLRSEILELKLAQQNAQNRK